MHDESDAFADWGRYTVAGYAKVRAHVQPVNFGNFENRPFNAYNTWKQ